MVSASSGIEQPAVRRVEARLRDHPRRLRAGGEALEEDRAGGLEAGPWANPHPGLGDHSQDALGAEDHAVGARTCPGAGQPAALPEAGRRQRRDRVDQVVDVGLQGGEMAARPGRDPAAEGGELERLGKMAQGEPAGPQAVLEVGPERPGPDQGRARDLVDLDDPAQRTEVDRDGPAVAVSDPGLDAADDARAAAEGHRRQPPVGAHLQHPPDVLGVAREGDHVGGPVEPPAEAADDVAIGAPHRVPDPVRRIGAEDVAELVGRAQPGRSGLDRGERHRLLDRVSAEAEPAAHLGRDRLQRCTGRSPLGVTPPPMAPGRAAGPRSARFHDPTLPTRPRIH